MEAGVPAGRPAAVTARGFPTMPEPCFLPSPRPVTLAEVAGWAGGHLVDEAESVRRIAGVAPLDLAGDGDLSFLDNKRYLPQLAA
ncbi:hypothetical protein J8J40_25105, partial [Mycobacterium tuberculosis]|nr:hypothetical protein [Mycobacterium tuberculosis]